jgi:MoxR-like ATPase
VVSPVDPVLTALSAAMQATGGGEDRWRPMCQAMSAAFGVSEDLFKVKTRSNPVSNMANALSERAPDGFKVLIYEGNEASAATKLDGIARAHLENSPVGGDEAVIVFVPAPSGAPSFVVHGVTALEHSPIVDGVKRHWPSVSLTLLPNPSSIREALSGVARLQPHFVPHARDSSMVKCRDLLRLAADGLRARLSARATAPVRSVDPQSGKGGAISTPYLRVFDPTYSPNASTGFCSIVIVAADGSSILVSIQQPATTGYPEERNLPKAELIAQSDAFHAELAGHPVAGGLLSKHNAIREMDLAGPAGRLGQRVQNYPHSNVACVRLDPAAMPSDFELVRLVEDFAVMTELLNKEKGAPVTSAGKSAIADHTHWPQDRVDEVLRSLRDGSPQVVLAGPPGTGKTFVARYLAAELLGAPGDVENERIKVVQFHPSYGYEEFVEGLRPVLETTGSATPAPHGAGITFAYKDGPILDLANRIRADGMPRVLIIDEINRANIARVFGELMFLLEYRDREIDLMSHKRFALPPELYIIATMNTADKSTRVMDVALRRRFDFFTVPPDRRILEHHYAGGADNHLGDELYDGFDALNAKLREDLDEHRLIGHSYFMADEFDVVELRRRWERQIKPLLDEYFFDTPDAVDTYSMGEFWPSAGA